MCFSLRGEFTELFLWSEIIYWWEMRCQLRKLTVSPNSLSCELLRNLQALGILRLSSARATPNRGQRLGSSGEMLIRTHWRSFKQPMFYDRTGYGWTCSSQCFHGVEKEILMCFQHWWGQKIFQSLTMRNAKWESHQDLGSAWSVLS